jgi:AraC-like DNA-binding protein
MKSSMHHIFNSVAELHSALLLKKPTNPLVSVVRLDDVDLKKSNIVETTAFNFYTIFLKKNFDGKVKYGQQYYDFDSGTMTFFSPKQLITVQDYKPSKLEGWMLVVHPDFIQNYPLGKKIRDYSFFGYAANEALHLSDMEEQTIYGIMKNLQQEIEAIIDGYTQDVVVAHIDLLLNYCNRFYNRQFITRKKVSNDLLIKFESLLTHYFADGIQSKSGLPSVQYFSEHLFVSANYLNDMLKNLTGQTTQQHIHNYIIDKAKELLSTTNLSVSEIAFELGFEYSQSFNKLFKNKTAQTPLEFRQSFN